MDQVIRVIGWVCVVLIVIDAIVVLVRRHAMNKVPRLFVEQGPAAALEYLEQPWVGRILHPYNYSYSKLNAYLGTGQSEKACQEFENLLAMKANDDQHKSVLLKAFQYYLEKGHAKDAKRLLDEIDQIMPDEVKRACHQSYDIIGLSKANHIGELEQEYKTAEEPRKSQCAYLLALQYGYKNDKNSCDMWKARFAAAQQAHG